MAGTARSNHPGGSSPAVLGGQQPASGPVSFGNVRRLQRKLWAAAKQSEGRRFHALYDRIYRSDVLWEAWERVKANRGAAGVDRVTLAAVEDYGAARMLDELARDLRAGIYRPAPVRRVGAPDVRVPAAPALQKAVLPSADWLVAAAMDMLGDSLYAANENS